MLTLNMPTSQEEVAQRWHRRLTAVLDSLNARQLAAHEEGQADAWQFEHDRVMAQLRVLEEKYPALAN